MLSYRDGRWWISNVGRPPIRMADRLLCRPGAEGNTAWPGPVPHGDSQPAHRCARITGMPFSIGDLLRSPSDLAAAARSVLGWTDEAVQVVADLPARVAALLDEADRLVARVGDTLDRVDAVTGRADAVVERVERVTGNAEQVVERIIPITGAADAVLESVGATSAGAQALLEVFQPMTERGAPLLQHFID